MREKNNGSTARPLFGYPVADFLDERALRRVTELLAGRVRQPGTGRRRPPPVRPEQLRQLWEGVTLGKLDAHVIEGRRPRYVYDIGLNSDRPTGFVLRNPFDTVLVFGRTRAPSSKPPWGSGAPPLDLFFKLRRTSMMAAERTARTSSEPRSDAAEKAAAKAARPSPVQAGAPDRPTTPVRPTPRPPKPPETDESPAPAERLCDFNARVILSAKGSIELVQIFGPDIRLYFSTGLVRPVRQDAQRRWIPTGERVGAPLGDRTITIGRGMTPTISEPLQLDDSMVQIGGRAVIAKLKSVRLGGSFEQPKLIFDHAEFELGG